MQEADLLPERRPPRSPAPAEYLALLSAQSPRCQQTRDMEIKNAHNNIPDTSGQVSGGDLGTKGGKIYLVLASKITQQEESCFKCYQSGFMMVDIINFK